MADQVAAIDANNKPSVTFVTDNASQEIRRGVIDDTTKALKVMLVGSSGLGTVTSITQSTGILLTPNPITTTGTVGLATNIAPIATLGSAGQSIRVNAGATALEYYTPGAASLTVGTTTIASGTTTRILYDNAGVLGEYTITGTGTVVAMQTSPSFTTPTLGVATATSINKVTITAPATGATLTLADNSSLITSGAFALTLTSTATSNATIPAGTNTLYSTLSGSITSAQLATSLTDETGTGVAVFGTTPTLTTSVLMTSGFVMNWNASNVVLTHSSGLLTLTTGDLRLPNAGTNNDSAITVNAIQTLNNKRVTPKSNTVASAGTPTINTDTTDIFTITALAVNITSFTTNLSGTPTNGQTLKIRILDNGTARSLAWGASFVARGVSLPTTTVLSKYLYVGFIWNSTASTWDCVASAQEA